MVARRKEEIELVKKLIELAAAHIANEIADRLQKLFG